MQRAPQRVLVTGAAGFVGRHMLRFLEGLPEGPGRIVAVDRATAPGSIAVWEACDLLDRSRVGALLARHQPEAIVHLAAAVSNEPTSCFSANVQVAENLFSEASRLPEAPRIIVVGSAAQYGSTGPGVAIVDESHPQNAETPYGVSKVLQERWALLYRAVRSLPVICTRPFNLLGPGQSTQLVPGAFMAQIHDVLEGRSAAVKVGNLSSRRDFVDVRDVAAAFWSLATTGEEALGQAFNIATGSPTGIDELLEACLELAGGGIPVEHRTDRLKQVDVSSMVGDAAKLRAQTGWRSTIPWRQSLAEMWAHLRSREAGQPG